MLDLLVAGDKRAGLKESQPFAAHLVVLEMVEDFV